MFCGVDMIRLLMWTASTSFMMFDRSIPRSSTFLSLANDLLKVVCLFALINEGKCTRLQDFIARE